MYDSNFLSNNVKGRAIMKAKEAIHSFASRDGSAHNVVLEVAMQGDADSEELYAHTVQAKKLLEIAFHRDINVAIEGVVKRKTGTGFFGQIITDAVYENLRLVITGSNTTLRASIVMLHLMDKMTTNTRTKVIEGLHAEITDKWLLKNS